MQLEELAGLAAAAQSTRTSLADLMATAGELAAAIQAGGVPAQAASVPDNNMEAGQVSSSSQSMAKPELPQQPGEGLQSGGKELACWPCLCCFGEPAGSRRWSCSDTSCCWPGLLARSRTELC